MSMLSVGLKKLERGISSAVGNITGSTAAKKANSLAEQALNDSRAERASASARENLANAAKTVEQQRINKKTARSARNSLRRPGFLDSSVEGTSDVLG